MRNKKGSENYIDKIPQIYHKNWTVTEGDIVEITVENTGFYHALAQKFFQKPRYSFIRLDRYGSCVWQQIDGRKSIYEIGQILAGEHDGAANMLYERLSTFFDILERNGYILFVNEHINPSGLFSGLRQRADNRRKNAKQYKKRG